MEVLIALICGVIGIVILGGVLLLPLRFKFVRELRQKSQQELEDLAFRYENEYFTYIGENHPEVIAFKTLTEQKDLPGIRKRWNDLSRSFVKLEKKAGHRGRPLIMEYYNWHELVLRELGRHGT
jgi:hypothetical protein